jgi:hypothetical protein
VAFDNLLAQDSDERLARLQRTREKLMAADEYERLNLYGDK